MLPSELVAKIRRIEIRTKRLVNDVFGGEYHSVFKGQGMEFEEVREYFPGDDIRLIDWNVTARAGAPFVKKFKEERELTVMILYDASSSGRFGTTRRMKGEMAAEMCALLAFSAIKNNDKVGMIIFTDRIEKFIAPKKGSAHVLRLVREILHFEPEGRSTDIAGALNFFLSVIRRKAVAFLVSDFLAGEYQRELAIANRKHDLIAVRIGDPRESEMVDVGLLELEDAETGEIVVVDTASLRVRTQYSDQANRREVTMARAFGSIDLDTVAVETGKSYVDPLIRFFRQRERRIRG
jgi:uncharacterized protein (DUF58 family)